MKKRPPVPNIPITLLVIVMLFIQACPANCEPNPFDWSDDNTVLDDIIGTDKIKVIAFQTYDGKIGCRWESYENIFGFRVKVVDQTDKVLNTFVIPTYSNEIIINKVPLNHIYQFRVFLIKSANAEEDEFLGSASLTFMFSDRKTLYACIGRSEKNGGEWMVGIAICSNLNYTSSVKIMIGADSYEKTINANSCLGCMLNTLTEKDYSGVFPPIYLPVSINAEVGVNMTVVQIHSSLGVAYASVD